MSIKFLILFITISAIFTSSIDSFTNSNFDVISISHLSGEFDIDFEKKIVHGDLFFKINTLDEGRKIILDTKNLDIQNVVKKVENEDKVLDFSFGNEDEVLGMPLIIDYGETFKKGEEFTINIKYSTKDTGKSATFLTEEQTIGKKNPFFFTVSKMILGRQLLPSQDTPAVKFPFYLSIKVPKNLRGMISGVFEKEELDGDKKVYYYEQKNPIPNYLISLAAGNIVERNITKNISLYCEPEFIEDASEVLEDFPQLFNATIKYLGEYVWEKFNILVLPNSFPYSTIENPYLAFCSQCLFHKDKSLIDVILNQLVHDWAGNLVTNNNWSDYWLNVGISTFIKRRIMSIWKNDTDYGKSDATIGLVYIDGWTIYFGEDSTFATLRPDFTGVNPDDYYSDIPIEKGFNLMYYIENLIGEEYMQKFLSYYFSKFKFTSISLNDFKECFNEFCAKNELNDKFKDLDFDKWITTPGKCPVDNDLKNNKYQIEVNKVLEKLDNADIVLDDELVKNVSEWNHLSKVNLLLNLENRDELLTDRQHDFLTKQLKFYENEDFIVSSNYFRMILSKTDKFYEHEMESIKKFLSTYGAFDYLAGTYEAFYKRDEVESINLFNSLKNYYHPLFISMVEDEIEFDKNTFPILTIELSDKDKCSFLDDLESQNKFGLVSEEYTKYKEVLDKYEINEGIYLETENEKLKVSCVLNATEKYCELGNEKKIEKSGEYTLNISERIQKINYAIKVHQSKMKIYTKKFEIDENKTNSNYSFDYAENQKQNIEIHFLSEPDEKISVMNGNKTIHCVKNSLILECEVDKKIFEVDPNNPKEYRKYELKVYDLCGVEHYSLDLNVKDSANKKPDEPSNNEQNNQNSKGLETWVIIVIIVGVILVLAIVLFFIIRACKKKNNIDVDSVKENNQLLDM